MQEQLHLQQEGRSNLIGRAEHSRSAFQERFELMVHVKQLKIVLNRFQHCSLHLKDFIGGVDTATDLGHLLQAETLFLVGVFAAQQ